MRPCTPPPTRSRNCSQPFAVAAALAESAGEPKPRSSARRSPHADACASSHTAARGAASRAHTVLGACSRQFCWWRPSLRSIDRTNSAYAGCVKSSVAYSSAQPHTSWRLLSWQSGAHTGHSGENLAAFENESCTRVARSAAASGAAHAAPENHSRTRSIPPPRASAAALASRGGAAAYAATRACRYGTTWQFSVLPACRLATSAPRAAISAKRSVAIGSITNASSVSIIRYLSERTIGSCEGEETRAARERARSALGSRERGRLPNVRSERGKKRARQLSALDVF